LQDSFVIRLPYKFAEIYNGKTYGDIDYSNPSFKMVMASSTEVPMKNLCLASGGFMKRHIAEGLVHMANGHYLKGLKAMISKEK
jgi:hypothetical protein